MLLQETGEKLGLGFGERAIVLLGMTCYMLVTEPITGTVTACTKMDYSVNTMDYLDPSYFC